MLATIVIGFFLFLLALSYLLPEKRTRDLINKIPGPDALPLIGNAHQLRFGHEWTLQLVGWVNTYKDFGLCRIWLGPVARLAIFKAEHVEVIVSSMKHIDKSPDYRFLHPWLGTGLLTSTGEKWRGRRKMLTPTFHFNILHDFVHVFNSQSRVLVKKMHQNVGKGPHNIFSDIALCALDIIAETAMGTNVDAQSTDSEYVHAVQRMTTLSDLRMRRPWFWSDFLFHLVGPGKEYDEKLKILHDFTISVIADRLKNFDNKRAELIRQEMSGSSTDSVGKKKVRLAFLDLLLYISDNLTKLSMEDIREEVDTFMFEGHDTTAAAMNWAAHLIGCDPKVQAKIHEELDQVFGDDDRDVTMDDLKELKYMDCCIKEALRLFPSVPLLARSINEEVQLGEFSVPEGTTVVVVPIALHRNPEVFPDPEKFDPDRFTTENSRNRHPYAYIPFSAGPRNCIGQKFAMLEEKTVLAHIFRNFTVKSCQTREELRPVGDLILRPEKGIVVELTPRKRDI